MKIFAPDYYIKFKCIASECRHNCCIGWEIDIDEATAEYYKNVSGLLGEKLNKSISYKDCPHFILDKHERCPFLDSNNLCEIISQLGEDALCQICADHPRYRNYFSDREEIGIGLSCEEAARIIVEKKDITRILELSDDGEVCEAYEDEKDFFKLRDRIFVILQNRDKRISDRLSEMLEFCNASFDFDIKKYTEAFLKLEYLDEKWYKILEEMRNCEYDTDLNAELDTAFEQISVYFVYRHLASGLDFSDFSGAAFFCALGTRMIMAVCAYHKHSFGKLTHNDIAEICRMYSSEIEYSEENTEILMTLGI